MKESVLDIVNKYLSLYPLEKDRLNDLQVFINRYSSDEIIDWNNFNGHIVASGFVYSKKDKKFLVLFHKDIKMYLYPGGHVEPSDKSILSAAIREVEEETGLSDIELLKFTSDENVPFDINIHITRYNERLNLPEHPHFDFRYLFLIDNISDVHVDTEELLDYKWITLEELRDETRYGSVANKIEEILKSNLDK